MDMTNLGVVIGVISAVAVAYQKLTEAIVKDFSERLKGIIKPAYICFVLSFFTCIFWKIGVLSLYKPVPLVFDAAITALIMAFEAGILNDVTGWTRAKKEEVQIRNNREIQDKGGE